MRCRRLPTRRIVLRQIFERPGNSAHDPPISPPPEHLLSIGLCLRRIARIARVQMLLGVIQQVRSLPPLLV
jgi:hypothetical protein